MTLTLLESCHFNVAPFVRSLPNKVCKDYASAGLIRSLNAAAAKSIAC